MKKILIIFTIAFILLFLGCQKDECKGKDNCYFERATVNISQTNCTLIKNPAIKKSCLSEIAISTSNLTLCKLINSSYCIVQIAENLKDFDTCNEVQDQEMRDVCHDDFASINLNFTMCKSIESASKSDDCYAKISSKSGQVTPCFEITDAEKKDTCIARRAIQLNNSDYCKAVVNLTTQEICYYYVADRTANPDICKNIIFKALRDDCLNSTKQEPNLNITKE